MLFGSPGNSFFNSFLFSFENIMKAFSGLGIFLNSPFTYCTAKTKIAVSWVAHQPIAHSYRFLQSACNTFQQVRINNTILQPAHYNNIIIIIIMDSNLAMTITDNKMKFALGTTTTTTILIQNLNKNKLAASEYNNNMQQRSDHCCYYYKSNHIENKQNNFY